MAPTLFNTLQFFPLGDSRMGQYYSLPHLEKEGIGSIATLPVSVRILLEAGLR